MISRVDYTCGIDFPALFLYFFFTRFTVLKIDSAVVYLWLAVNMARFGNVNTDKFTSVQCVVFFYVQNKMLSNN